MIPKTNLIYLASLYSLDAKTPKVLEERYQKVLKLTSLMVEDGYIVYSPIVHNHPVNKLFKHDRPTFDFWRKFDTKMLSKCDCLAILVEKGWKESVGITAELEFAKTLNIPIYYITLIKDNFDISETEVNPIEYLMESLCDLEFYVPTDKLEGKRCLSCGRFVKKDYWHLTSEDHLGCGLRPLCSICA